MAEQAPGGAAPPTEKRKGAGKRRLILALAGLLVLAGGAGGAWYAGLLPIPGLPAPGAQAEGAAAQAEAQAARPPAYLEMPDIVTNLNSGTRRQSFVKLRARLEMPAAELVPAQAAMPRLLDLFTTYLRETRPEELRGSAGTHRLREEMLARANLVLKPGTVSDVLFTELVVQ